MTGSHSRAPKSLVLNNCTQSVRILTREKTHSICRWFRPEAPCTRDPGGLLNAPGHLHVSPACCSSSPSTLAVRTRVLPAVLSLLQRPDPRPRALFSRSSPFVRSSRRPVRGVLEAAVCVQCPAWVRNPEAGRSLSGGHGAPALVRAQRRSGGLSVSYGSLRWGRG